MGIVSNIYGTAKAQHRRGGTAKARYMRGGTVKARHRRGGSAVARERGKGQGASWTVDWTVDWTIHILDSLSGVRVLDTRLRAPSLYWGSS